jgi:hypothetical protein
VSKESKEVAKVQESINTVVTKMEAMSVQTDEEVKQASEFLRKIKQSEKVVHEVFDPQVKALHEPYKAKTDERKGYLDQLSKAERVVKRMIGDYQTEQRRIREEQARKEREAEEERRLAAAIDTGHEEVLDRPVTSAKPPEPEKLEGVYTTAVWKYEVLDKQKVNAQFLTVDEKKVGQLVRSMKDEAAALLGPGIRVYAVDEVRARA